MTEKKEELGFTEDELFEILDQFMSLPPEELPSREEIETRYPAMAHEIWRCLEGMKLLKTEESSRKLAQMELPSIASSSFDSSDSTANFSVSSTCGGKKPEHTMGMDPIGDFELVREIARGGMGIVYEAWQNSLNRLVALKVLPLASTFDKRQLLRFQNEAASAAQLDHPGIVPIYAIGSDRGVHFYAMKLIQGFHLGEIIRSLRKERRGFADSPTARFSLPTDKTKGIAKFPLKSSVSEDPLLKDESKIGLETETGTKTLSNSTVCERDSDTGTVPEMESDTGTVSESVSDAGVSQESFLKRDEIRTLYAEKRQEYFRLGSRLMKQAAEALEYAHQCGIIHRDIKPANLMLDAEQRLWITDFGLAQVCSDVHLTQTGEVFGTPRYMSPEQAQGNHRLADHRVDIYSLGATFYEFFTLNPIFSETNQVVLLKQIAQDEPKRPRVWESAIPRDLETILLKCLAKSPEDRYVSAGELAADLERFLENRPILARRPGILEVAAKWNYRHPWATTLTFLAFLAVWVGTVVSHQMILQEKEKTQKALAEAQARFEKARSAADKLVKIAEEELAADQSPEIRRAQQKVLDTALVLYQDFLKIDELDPQTEQQLTAIRNYVEKFMELLSESRAMPPIFLLMDPEVQHDLKIDFAQKEKIDLFGRDFRKQSERLFRESRNFTSEERVNRMLEQISATEEFLEEVLSDSQQKRLRQIQLQMQPERICDASVREELGLSDEQTAELERKLAFTNFNFSSMHGNRQGGGMGGGMRQGSGMGGGNRQGGGMGGMHQRGGRNWNRPGSPQFSQEQKPGTSQGESVKDSETFSASPQGLFKDSQPLEAHEIAGKEPQKPQNGSETGQNVELNPEWGRHQWKGPPEGAAPEAPFDHPSGVLAGPAPNSLPPKPSNPLPGPSSNPSPGQPKGPHAGRGAGGGNSKGGDGRRMFQYSSHRFFMYRQKIIESILTEEQLEAWKKMQGEPFGKRP